MKKVISMLLVLALCLSGLALAEDAQPAVYRLGDKMDDFTMTTYEGKSVTLSEVLKEKEMVLINIWATWCGPCRNEFPFLEEAYQQYQDKVEVLALSCEPTDDDSVLADFAAELGLTFPVGRDEDDLSSRFSVEGIPASIVVDRFGTICFYEEGSQPDTDAFIRLFNAFLGDEYTESVLLDTVPRLLPTVAPSSEADLAAALNVEGGKLTFTNGTEETDWPMVVGEKDGRSVAISSNANVGTSDAVLHTAVSAKAGDAIVVTFKVSSETACDVMQLRINGETVKSFGGEKDWMTYAYAVPTDGEYAVTVAFVNDTAGFDGEDTLWVDSVALVSGDAAAEALAANPVYPVADATTITACDEGAKQIVISDPTGEMANYYGDQFYLIPGETATFELTVTGDIDPDAALVYCNFDGATYALADCLVDGKYMVTSGGDSMETSGYSESTICIYPTISVENFAAAVTYFKSEENANAFVSSITDDNDEPIGSWTYADGTAPSTDALPESSVEALYAAAYTVKYVDQDGNPVAGVTCQVCDDATCQIFVSDEDGVCAFTLAPYPWEIHTLKVPEGYEGDTETVTTAPVEGGELTFTLTKQ